MRPRPRTRPTRHFLSSSGPTSEADLMVFWVQYPELQTTGRVVWRRRQTHPQRYLEQLEFEW